MVTGSIGRRQARVAETIRGELARLITREINDPRLHWVTITGVDTSPDLKRAKVHFVATGSDDHRPIQRSLEKAAPFLQRELGRNLKLKNTPRLDFAHDASFDEAAKIETLIEQVRVEKQAMTNEDKPEQRLGELVAEADSILLATHRNPDGDAIGSLLGMSGILSLMGKEHYAYCPDGIPEVLRGLPGTEFVTDVLDDDFQTPLTILLDTADESLLPDGFPEEKARGSFVVIDHHKQHSDMGDVIIRRMMSSVGELLFDLARELMWPLDANVAMCLYTSIVADTGSFRYASTAPKTHRAAAELIELGAKPWEVATALYESHPLARQRLLGDVIQTLRVTDDGRFASLYATPQMLEKCGATKAELDGMVNVGRSVGGVEISALVRLADTGKYRVSYRSKGRIDVGALAARFGGGGHVNAAGCTIEAKDMEAARDQVEEVAIKYLEEYDQLK